MAIVFEYVDEIIEIELMIPFRILTIVNELLSTRCPGPLSVLNGFKHSISGRRNISYVS